jgi:hypothetical protein
MTATDLPTADQCEQVFHAALGQGDTAGWSNSLRILIVHDPHRAERLIDLARVALGVAEKETAR